MAHFARVDETFTVVDVIRVGNNHAPDPAPVESESLGQDFISEVLGLPGAWIQTSYNNHFRKQYAGIGYRYDREADVFISPPPFSSWVLDSNHDWQPPTPYPNDGNLYRWDEATLSWVEVTPEA